MEDDPTGGKFAGASNLLQGAAHKLEDIINFHAGDTVTALQRAAMQPGGREVILYGTVMGAIGTALTPECPKGGGCLSAVLSSAGKAMLNVSDALVCWLEDLGMSRAVLSRKTEACW